MLLKPSSRKRISRIGGEPIDIEIAKAHCLVFHNNDDALFGKFIGASRDYAEQLADRRFLTQQWEFTYRAFPSWRGSIPIPDGPVQSIDSISYLDSAGVSQLFGTFSGSPLDIEEYFLLNDEISPRIALRPNCNWPATFNYAENAVTVTLTLGFGDTADDIPEIYVAGMLMLIGHMNENRESVVVGDRIGAFLVPLGIRDLLAKPRCA